LIDVLKTSSYDFNLPASQIATFPVNPPSSAKMLVYNREKNEIFHSTFENILEFLPQDLTIFLNDTKVIKARIFGQKSTGAKLELLLNKPLFMDRYLVMIKGKVKIGTKIFFDENLIAEVLELNEDGTRVVSFFKDENSNKRVDFLSLVEILNKIGHIPLPPYMQRDDKKEDEVNYQTLFAKNYGGSGICPILFKISTKDKKSTLLLLFSSLKNDTTLVPSSFNSKTSAIRFSSKNILVPIFTFPFIITKYLSIKRGLFKRSSNLAPVDFCPNILAFITFVSFKNIVKSCGKNSKIFSKVE
jgi:hypothetical protein